MDRFWKAALGVAGIGAVAFLTLLSLYQKWLTLPIFSQVDSNQTFVLMLVFLVLTFSALIAGLVAWRMQGRRGESEDAALHRLEQAWSNVNYIDCDALVASDVNNAANALQMTSIYWRNGFISKGILLEKYAANFCELFDQISGCDKQVPGYTKPKKYCRDFLPAPVRATYEDIKATSTR
jgi:hypothetical protein